MTSPPADSDQIRSRLLNKLGIYDAQPPPPTSVAPAGLGSGGGSALKPPTSTTSPTITTTKGTRRHQPILTAAQHRRLRILRGMGVGYTFQQYSPPDGSAIRPPLNGAAPRVEPLKGVIDGDDDDNHDDDDMMMMSNNHNNTISDEMKLSTTPDQEDERDNNNSDNNNNKKTTRIAFQDQVEVVQIPTRYEYSDRIRSRIWSNRHELQENAERNAVEFAAEGWNWRNVTEDEGMYICSVSGELVHPIHLQHLVGEQQEAQQEQEQQHQQEHQQDDQQQSQQPPTRKGLERGAPVHSSS